MACLSPRNVIFNNLSSRKCSSWRRRRHNSVMCCDTRGSSTSLVLQIAKLLGPAASFQASKLKVVFFGEEIQLQRRIIPRIYTLTHCDLTANLTLAISNTINIDQLNGWYNKLWMDDVIAEWKKTKEELSLHVHCHVSGAHPLLNVAAEFRYYIFTKELPLVLKAVIYGDSELFHEYPQLMDSTVWVHFHSNSHKYNRVECWGPLKEAAQGKHGALVEGSSSRTLTAPKSIFNALFTFLL